MTVIWDVSYFILFLLVINMFFAIAVIFMERKDPTSTWAWLLVLFFLPFVGFILYLLFGRQLRKKHLFRWDGQKYIGIERLVKYQKKAIKNDTLDFRNTNLESYKRIIYMNLSNNDALLTQDNHIDIFDDGKDKFEALIKDIEGAKEHIHVQYYILRLDGIGKRIVDILIAKAKQGVQVRVLYDAIGTRLVKKRHYKELLDAGGEVEVFFPSIFPLINPRLNYRNHRKIVVVDGRIGYIGGFNVGDEYLGLDKKFGYWRDTHLRIEGSAVHLLQSRFLLDWNQAASKKTAYSDSYFPVIPKKGDAAVQIVSSGPESEWEQIKDGYLRLIMKAQKYVYIQTPYFIPDQSFLDAVKIAALSGVDVRIMIPNKPDHIFVYWATYSYVGQLLQAGARIYIYEKGFIHAKAIVIDDEASTVGTANIDMRSFRLNFEVNAFIYDNKISHDLAEIFEKDILDSSELTMELYNNRSLLIKFKESIARLVSPIL